MERKYSMKMHLMTETAPTEAAYKQVAGEQPPKVIHTRREHRDWKRVLGKLLTKPEAEMTAAEVSYAETVALLIEDY